LFVDVCLISLATRSLGAGWPVRRSTVSTQVVGQHLAAARNLKRAEEAKRQRMPATISASE
jgi:hypothetical protein